jgi:hypothetical protein
LGSDSARLARAPWEAADRARTLLRNAYSYAERLGIRTGIGFEPYMIPDKIFRALPPEAKLAKPVGGARFDIESVTSRKRWKRVWLNCWKPIRNSTTCGCEKTKA